jgi:hypothetical protein
VFGNKKRFLKSSRPDVHFGGEPNLHLMRKCGSHSLALPTQVHWITVFIFTEIVHGNHYIYSPYVPYLVIKVTEHPLVTCEDGNINLPCIRDKGSNYRNCSMGSVSHDVVQEI